MSTRLNFPIILDWDTRKFNAYQENYPGLLQHKNLIDKEIPRVHNI